MTATIETHVQAVDATTLTPIVLRATGCTEGELVEWTSEPIRPTSGNWGSSVIYRFSGTVRQQDETLPWSLVLKVSCKTIEAVGGAAGADDTALRREAAFYRSDLIQDFPAGFRPARCYALDEQVGQAGRTEYWFWLEDLGSRSASRAAGWTVDDYERAAYGLGLSSGTFIDHPALPDATWLKRDDVRGYVEHAAPQFHALFADRITPLVQRAFPASAVDSLRALWQSRETHLLTLDRLPQTLVHGDAQQTNLFLITDGARDPGIAAIDWCAVGVGPLGLDAAQLFATSAFTFTTGVGQLADVAEGIYERYLAGVQAAGWQGDPRVVRLGYTTSMFRVRTMYVWRYLQFLMDETVQKRVARQMQAHGVTLEDNADRVRYGEQCARALFEESLTLRDQLL
jgi:hypothetical protein